MTSLFSTRARTALGALSVAAVLTLSACGGSDSSDSDAGKDASKDASSSASPSAGASDGAAEGPQPDLDAIPDVVAEVNGEEVTKEEFVPIYEAAFQQAAAQAQMGGEDPDEEALRKETADNLVDTELLAPGGRVPRPRGHRRGRRRRARPSLAEQNGMRTADELLKAVEAQGVSADQAREQVETQAMVEQLVERRERPDRADRQGAAQALRPGQEAAGGQSGGGGQEIPPFAQVRDQLAEQASSQETGKVATALVEDLRKDADITINL